LGLKGAAAERFAVAENQHEEHIRGELPNVTRNPEKRKTQSNNLKKKPSIPTYVRFDDKIIIKDLRRVVEVNRAVARWLVFFVKHEDSDVGSFVYN
jgi:hypothetical protein